MQKYNIKDVPHKMISNDMEVLHKSITKNSCIGETEN